jgi:hypothetical protein
MIRMPSSRVRMQRFGPPSRFDCPRSSGFKSLCGSRPIVAATALLLLGMARQAGSSRPYSGLGIRAYEKAGFTGEGRYRESVLHDGRWYDEVLMSILDHEWAADRSSGRCASRYAGAMPGTGPVHASALTGPPTAAILDVGSRPIGPTMNH